MLNLTDGAYGRFGLNRATKRGDGSMEIHPFIGVGHQTVEKKLAEIRGQPLPKGFPPTIRVYLMYLMTEARMKDSLDWIQQDNSIHAINSPDVSSLR